MKDADPDKLLAELEAARLAIAAKRPSPGRRALLILGALLILAIAIIALFVLAMKLDGMQKPLQEDIKPVTAFSPVFPEILLCPARSNFLTSPIVISGLA